MANKRKRKRLRMEATERKKQEDRERMEQKKWDAQHARYVGKDAEPEKFLYDVAAQISDGKPVYAGTYRAATDEELIELVVKMLGVNKEADLNYLAIHKHMPNKLIAVIRDKGQFPTRCSIIRTKGITERGRLPSSTKPTTELPAIVKPSHTTSARPKETTPTSATTEKVLEKSIPRALYTLKEAA